MAPETDEDEEEAEQEGEPASGDDEWLDEEPTNDDFAFVSNRFFFMCFLVVYFLIAATIVGACAGIFGFDLGLWSNKVDNADGGSAKAAYVVGVTIAGALLLVFSGRGRSRKKIAYYLLPIMFMLMGLLLIRR